MSLLENLQKLPYHKRKTILLVIVVAVAVSFFIFWLINLKNTLKNFPQGKIFQGLEPPQVSEGLIRNPREEFQVIVPESGEQELKKLEQLLEEEQKQFQEK